MDQRRGNGCRHRGTFPTHPQHPRNRESADMAFPIPVYEAVEDRLRHRVRPVMEHRGLAIAADLEDSRGVVFCHCDEDATLVQTN